MPVAGDREVAQLVVDNYGEDTYATLAVTDPNGVQITPLGPVSEDGHKTWWADVHFTVPGLWRLAWNVTGSGAGTVLERVPVGPADVPLGRVYATTTDLANYLNAAPSEDAEGKLRDATVLIDRLLISAVYDVDGKDMPTDPVIKAALRDAVCEQVNWWAQTGDQHGARAAMGTVHIGSITLSGPSGGSSNGSSPRAPGRISPQAVVILENAGLLGQAPVTW